MSSGIIHSWPEGPWVPVFFAFSHLQSLYSQSPATYIRCNNRLGHKHIYSKHRHSLLKPPSFCTGKTIHLYLKRGMGLVSLISIVAFFHKKKAKKAQQKKQTNSNKQNNTLFMFFGPELGVVSTKKRTRDILAVLEHLVQS